MRTSAKEVAGLDSALLAAFKADLAVSSEADMVRAARFAAVKRICMAQDAVLLTWPRYRQVRDELRQELAATMDLDRTTVDGLREEAAALRAAFWQKDGTLSSDGYQDIYRARVLLEIAHDREPADLAVSDDLVQAIMAAHPASTFKPGQQGSEMNAEVFDDLRALRSHGYEQTRREVENGRPFTWEDFARAADFAGLFSDVDPPKAAEAFEWALAQAGPDAMKPQTRDYYNNVLRLIRAGGGVNFEIYNWPREDFLHECLYGRRWPSFRRPNPDPKGSAPMVSIAEGGQSMAFATGRTGGG